ncbi:hypothetical protein GCM10011492_15810 [Flexivirga endophytica]|uniref:Uncharacterized protein n=1 Tax=Flexivirga endophytica TaxID=1849103 RepID=A0A916WSR2_9MICO|nr:hypothetical protein GCM10011492_15810 [Flexivirga endophytica]
MVAVARHHDGDVVGHRDIAERLDDAVPAGRITGEQGVLVDVVQSVVKCS